MFDHVPEIHLTPITKFMAHLPLAYHPGKPESALIICFGMGTTYSSALSWETETTAIELIPSVADLPDRDKPLMEQVVKLAEKYGRYGYRRITALLQNQGWQINHKRVERIWRIEGLKVPQKQPKRGRLWLNDGSCIRLRPERRNHVWSYDFLFDRTHDGRALKLLTVIDEYTRECLAIEVGRRLTSRDVLRVLAGVMLRRGVPAHIRSDNGPEFVAKTVGEWLGGLAVSTLFI